MPMQDVCQLAINQCSSPASEDRSKFLQVEKTNHTTVTEDGWRLHIVRTQKAQQAQHGMSSRTFPIVLVPGLCSSGAYTFDLSPVCSLADWLAERDWDVWTIELRGNGLSDKPALLSHRSHWWTVDDMVERDIPAALGYICTATGCSAAHCLGHSMGGMILTAALGRCDATSARIRSATLVGSSCFLQGSWWQVTRPALNAAKLMHSVPAGASLRLYSNLAFTKLGIRALDILYFWPSNTDPALARAVLARNFSSTSPGVILQFGTAFDPEGLRSTRDNKQPFAGPERLSKVHTPVMLICGDRDKMCPPWGATKQYEMLSNSRDKKLAILGPRHGQRKHYGHFDILMGKHVHEEVFPTLLAWFEKHDACDDVVHDMQPAQGMEHPRQGAEQLVAAAACGLTVQPQSQPKHHTHTSSVHGSAGTAAHSLHGSDGGVSHVSHVSQQPSALSLVPCASHLQHQDSLTNVVPPSSVVSLSNCYQAKQPYYDNDMTSSFSSNGYVSPRTVPISKL